MLCNRFLLDIVNLVKMTESRKKMKGLDYAESITSASRQNDR